MKSLTYVLAPICRRGSFRNLRDTFFPRISKYKLDLQFIIEKHLGIEWAMKIGIHRVLVIPTPWKVYFFVRVYRPGILIGRRGTTIQAVTNDLTEWVEKPCEIRMREFDPFYD